MLGRSSIWLENLMGAVMTVAKTVEKFSPSIKRLRVFVVITALLALPFTIYYLSYVRSQCGYFTDRSFRKLSTISNQLALRVENAATVFKNSSDKFIRPQVREGDSPTFDTNPAQKQQNLERLKEVFKKLKGDRQIIALNIDTEPWNDKLSPGTVTLNTVKHDGESSWLYLDYVAEGILPKTVIRVQAKTDLNRLIQPFLSARVGSDYDQFQNILITEGDTARVIFQHDTTEVRVASLDKLPSSQDQGKKIDLKEIAQTSNVVDVSLAGSNYRLFSHPLKLSLPGSDANSPNTTWITSGLVRSNYFQTEAWSISIPFTILIFGGFVIALIVFSWPFLKLVLAGPKDRFRPRDVYFLVFAMLSVLAVFTCFGLYASVYTSVETEMDSQVEGLASEIKQNFDEELNEALHQLEILSRNDQILDQLKQEEKQRKAKDKTQFIAAALPNSHAKLKSVAAHAEAKPDLYHQRDINKTDILPAILRSRDTTYRYFDSVSWIDAWGMQRAKWTIKSYNTQYISLAGRGYFDNIRKGRFFEHGEHKFWLEPVISNNTGRNQIVISMAIPKESWIVASDMRLLSLMDPVLPVGYGYAIIAQDGKVLFHSDEANHLGENLFQECDDDPELLSSVLGRSDKALNVRYLGEDHRFFVAALKGFPEWSLVVFRNKQPLRSIFFELLTSVSVLFLIYGLVVMAGFTVFYIINVVKERRAWFWPSEKKAAIYVHSILLLFGLSVISLTIVILSHGEKLVWITAGIGLFTGFVYFGNLAWGSKSPFLKYVSRFTNRFKRHNRLYVVNATLLLFVIAILPAWSFFKYAYESQAELFIKHAQYSLAKALAKRDERIRSQYANIKFAEGSGSNQSGSEQARNKFLNERLDKSWDVYDRFFFHTGLANPDPEATCTEAAKSNLLARLNAILPLSNRASIERRGLLDSTSVESVGQWETAATGSLVLHLDRKPGKNESQLSHLNSSVPLLGIPRVAAFAIVVLFLLLFLFVNYVIRKVFLLDLHKPSTHSLKTLLSEKIQRNVFVVVDAPFVKKAPGNGSNLYLKDLPSIATSSDWADTFDKSSGDESTVIALDRFDYGMDDPHINQQKLKLVENLLGKKRTLMIFSSAEASLYRFSNGDNGDAKGDFDGRWAGVIVREFSTEYAEDTDDGSRFAETVNQEKTRILAQRLPDRPMEEIDELFLTLYAECASREPLQRVGLQILAQRDFITLSRAHLVARIVNQARPYYTHIWNSCSPGERQTLCHLAQDRLLSHRDPDIEPLLRRELIVKEDDLHLFNESFRQFVKSSDRVLFVVERDKEAQQGSLWQTLKVPVLVALLAITAFLFLTQQDLYSRSLALVTGLTTLIPALFKVLSMFQSDPFSRPPSQP